MNVGLGEKLVPCAAPPDARHEGDEAGRVAARGESDIAVALSERADGGPEIDVANTPAAAASRAIATADASCCRGRRKRRNAEWQFDDG